MTEELQIKDSQTAGNGGTFGSLEKDQQTAQTQQPAAAPAAQPKKKPAYDGPGLQRPQSSGFMQQLTGVVNQGKNLMRSDINARMGAWHDATQHPERASEFLKAQPLTSFKGVKDIAEDGRKEMYEATGNTDLANAEYAETLNDPYAAIIAIRNKQAALEQDEKDMEGNALHTGLPAKGWGKTLRDPWASMNKIGNNRPRVQLKGAPAVEGNPYGPRSIAYDTKSALNRLGGDVDATKRTMNFYQKTDPDSTTPGQLIAGANAAANGDEFILQDDAADIDRRILSNIMFRESATLIDGYLGGLQDRGYISGDQREFAKAVFGDDETDAAVGDAAAEDAMDDFEAQGKKHMLDTKKERNAAIQPIVQDKNKIRGADNLGYKIGYNNSPDGSVGFFGATDGGVGAWDAGVDMASYLEDLMNKGIIDADQYLKARRAFDEGKTLGNFDRRLEEQAIKRMSEKRPKMIQF